MTEQETVMLIETEQRCKSNTHRIDNLEGELKEIQSEQKAIYKIATSVELIAQRVSNIEGKVDDTNRKVDAQAKAWQETERKLSEKVTETENQPYKQIAKNVNSVKVAIITCICTLLVSGIIGAIIAFGKKHLRIFCGCKYSMKAAAGLPAAALKQVMGSASVHLWSLTEGYAVPTG